MTNDPNRARLEPLEPTRITHELKRLARAVKFYQASSDSNERLLARDARRDQLRLIRSSVLGH